MAATMPRTPKSTPRIALARVRANYRDLQAAIDDTIATFDPLDARLVQRLAELSDAYQQTIAHLAHHELHEAGR